MDPQLHLLPGLVYQAQGSNSCINVFDDFGDAVQVLGPHPLALAYQFFGFLSSSQIDQHASQFAATLVVTVVVTADRCLLIGKQLRSSPATFDSAPP